MKICFIATKSGDFGGSEVLWYLLAKEALLAKHKVLVCIHSSYQQHPEIKELQKLGAILQVRQSNRLDTLYGKIKFKIRGLYLPLNPFYPIQSFAPDLVLVSQGGTYDAAGHYLLYKFLMQVRVPFFLVSQFHFESTQLPEKVKVRAQRLFLKATTIFFVADRNRTACEKTLSLVLQNAQVINNPIKVEWYEAPWPSESTYQLAFVARLDFTIKRQDLLIQILNREPWISRNLQVNLYGDGKDRERLKKLLNDPAIKAKIKWMGHVENIAEIWQSNHLFLLPSIAEGLPLSLIEANLFGRAAITTDVGDNSLLVLNGETGFLIPALDELALEETLEKAWTFKNEWKTLGKAASKHTKQTIDVNVHKTLLKQLENHGG